MRKNKVLIILHLLIAVYSLSGVFSKIAGTMPFLSLGFCLSYAVVIAILGIYAIGWQQIIKHIPLTTAFANKAFTVVWGLVFGVVFFGEEITAGKIAGILLVVLGVVLYSGADTEEKNVE